MALKAPGATATRAEADNYKNQIEAATQTYQAVTNAAMDPIAGIEGSRYRNKQIMDITREAVAGTGPGRSYLNQLASIFPGSSGDPYQLTVHYLNQNTSAALQSMGLPNTNAGAEVAAGATGNAQQNPGVILEVSKINDAVNTARDKFFRGMQLVTNGGNDMSLVNAYKSEFARNFDMNALRVEDAIRRKDADDLEKLKKQLGPDGMAEARRKLNNLHWLSTRGKLPGG